MTRLSIATIALLLVVGNIASSQTTGSLAGTITDENGKPIAGATVRILGTSPARGAITRQNGSFRIAGIRAEAYSIQITSVGCKIHIQNDVFIRADTTATVNACLVRAPVHIDSDTLYDTLPPPKRRKSDSAVISNANRTTIRGTNILPLPCPAVGVNCTYFPGRRATETAMRAEAIELPLSRYDITRDNSGRKSPDILTVSSGIAGDYMDTHPEYGDGDSLLAALLQQPPIRLGPVIVTAQAPIVVPPERVGKAVSICSCGHGKKRAENCGHFSESPTREIDIIRPELR